MKKITLITLLIVFGITNYSMAELLAEFNLHKGTVSSGPFDEINPTGQAFIGIGVFSEEFPISEDDTDWEHYYDIFVGAHDFGNMDEYNIFSIPILHGQTGIYTLNSGSKFENAVALLTNGIENAFSDVFSNDFPGITHSYRQSTGSDFFSFSYTDKDLYGYNITSFEFELNSATLGVIDNKLYSGYEGDFRIYGSQVPIPGAVWLFSSGIIGLIGIRRKIKSGGHRT